jgi:hypothetical protein
MLLLQAAKTSMRWPAAITVSAIASQSFLSSAEGAVN